MTAPSPAHRARQAWQLLGEMGATWRSWPLRRWWQFWVGRSPETTIELDGIWLAIRTATWRQKAVDLSMAYECIVRDDYRLAEWRPPPGGATVVDIGGHIGAFSLAAARRFADVRVVCYEPSPENFAQLRKNLALNGAANVQAHNLAVAAQPGVLDLYLDTENSAANSLFTGRGRPVRVTVTSLEEVLDAAGFERCSLLKLDCEGAEYAILMSTTAATLDRIDRIVMEYHDPEYFGVADGPGPNELLAHLEKHGLRCTARTVDRYQGLAIATRAAR